MAKWLSSGRAYDLGASGSDWLSGTTDGAMLEVGAMCLMFGEVETIVGERGGVLVGR